MCGRRGRRFWKKKGGKGEFLGGRVRMGDVGLLGGGYVGVGTGDLGIWIVSLVGRGV